MDKWSSNSNAIAATRLRMVREPLSEFPPRAQAVLDRVPRHEFLPEATISFAHADGTGSIGFGQTISQPYIVALMKTQLDPRPASASRRRRHRRRDEASPLLEPDARGAAPDGNMFRRLDLSYFPATNLPSGGAFAPVTFSLRRSKPR